jgi:AraC-like DNA-binding protein
MQVQGMEPSPEHGAISARMVLRVVEFCRARGHDGEALCRSANTSLTALTQPDARVPYALAARISERALALTREPNFGLELARDVGDPKHYDAGLLFLMASSSLRVALERMVARQRYWGDGERARLTPVPGGLALRYTLPGASGEYGRQSDECAMAEVALGARALSGRALLARVVRFRHPAPRDTSEHRSLFRCQLEFDRAHTEIVFDDHALDAPMRHTNEAFCAIFEQQVEQALARLPTESSASAGVRAAVRIALGGGGCTLEGTARSLGVSTRTLQRRLKTEGTSFGAIVDALRRELASVYVARGISVPEVATLLGYSDATAFHHAFRRWTGSSPARKGRAQRN